MVHIVDSLLRSEEVSDRVSVVVDLSDPVFHGRYLVIDQVIYQFPDVHDERVVSGDGGWPVLILVQHLKKIFILNGIKGRDFHTQDNREIANRDWKIL